MNGHLGQLLEAYLDGELSNGQKRQAEAHLEGCPECRGELARRRALSVMLKAEPLPSGGKSEQRFVSEIALQLPRKAAGTSPSGRPASLVWMGIPVALVLAWAFVQASAIVVSALEWIPGAEDTMRSSLAASITQIEIPQVLRDVLRPVAAASFGSWDGVVLMMVLIGIGVLFTGWFAGWWISQRDAGSHR